MKKGSKFGKFLAFVGALTIIGGICFLIYKLTKPDYLDEYDDDDYDEDRYNSDSNYADGVDDAMDELDW